MMGSSSRRARRGILASLLLSALTMLAAPAAWADDASASVCLTQVTADGSKQQTCSDESGAVVSTTTYAVDGCVTTSVPGADDVTACPGVSLAGVDPSSLSCQGEPYFDAQRNESMWFICRDSDHAFVSSSHYDALNCWVTEDILGNSSTQCPSEGPTPGFVSGGSCQTEYSDDASGNRTKRLVCRDDSGEIVSTSEYDANNCWVTVDANGTVTSSECPIIDPVVLPPPTATCGIEVNTADDGTETRVTVCTDESGKVISKIAWDAKGCWALTNPDGTTSNGCPAVVTSTCTVSTDDSGADVTTCPFGDDSCTQSFDAEGNPSMDCTGVLATKSCSISGNSNDHTATMECTDPAWPVPMCMPQHEGEPLGACSYETLDYLSATVDAAGTGPLVYIDDAGDPRTFKHYSSRGDSGASPSSDPQTSVVGTASASETSDAQSSQPNASKAVSVRGSVSLSGASKSAAPARHVPANRSNPAVPAAAAVAVAASAAVGAVRVRRIRLTRH